MESYHSIHYGLGQMPKGECFRKSSQVWCCVDWFSKINDHVTYIQTRYPGNVPEAGKP